MINQILNERYQIQQELGRQTGRRTFLAEDLQIQQQVVVKLLLLGQDFDWQDLKLFKREAETLKALNYSNIPRYLDYFELDYSDDKSFGLVQTYVDGKTLEEYLQAGRTFSEAEVKQLAISLLEILTYLHQHEPPIIHRDIKPSNIILTEIPYLVDFGSVQAIAATNAGTITVVGTYGYMPPEQFGGRCIAASDLYSLGATLIYLITGLHPTELPQKDLQIQFRQAANCSEEFADWLEWMTEPSLNQRFKSTQEAIEALENPVPRKKANSLLKQPPDSEIQLHKTADNLEIVIPPQGFRIPQIALISLTTSLAGGFFTSKLDTHFQITFLIHLIQGCAAISILLIILWTLFKHTRLQISKKRILFTYELFGIKWLFLQKQLIFKLKFIDTYSTEYEAKPTFLYIKADSEEFCFNKYANFTAEELEWFAQEISDYLDVPISRV